MNPPLRAGANSLHRRFESGAVQSVATEDFPNLLRLDLWHASHLSVLTSQFHIVRICFAARREIATQSHGDGAGGHLSDSRDEHNETVIHCAREAGRQREWHSEAIGHTDRHVTHGRTTREMGFPMGCAWVNNRHGPTVRES